MNVRERLRRWFRLRFAVIYPFGIFIMLFSNSDDTSIMASIGFIIAGLGIRLWANGYAVKMDRLTTSGPYAFMRHPLYLGTMLIVVGFIVMLRIYYIGISLISIMALVYFRVIKREEVMLEKKFKNLYNIYKREVPCIFPSIRRFSKGEKWSFSFRRLIHSQEYKVFLWVVIFMIVFHLKDEFIIEREAIDAKILGLIVTAFTLGMFDFMSEFIKRKKTRDCALQS